MAVELETIGSLALCGDRRRYPVSEAAEACKIIARAESGKVRHYDRAIKVLAFEHRLFAKHLANGKRRLLNRQRLGRCEIEHAVPALLDRGQHRPADIVDIGRLKAPATALKRQRNRPALPPAAAEVGH